MKRSRWLAVLVFVFAQPGFAYEYEITCANKTLTKFQSVGVDQNSDECKAFIANGFLKCFDSKRTNQSSEAMTLSTPNDHYYQNKESTRYSRKTIQAIIDSAIKAGNDPYLTLSIVITENPPTISAKKGALSNTEIYADSYGTIPLDAIAVADTMSCDRVQTDYGNGLMRLQNGDRVKRIIVDPQGVEKTVCIVNQFTAGEGANFYVVKDRSPDDCCMIVRANSSGFVTQSAGGPNEEPDVNLETSLKTKVMNVLAQKYMANRFAAARKRAADERLPESRMAMVAQAYNGYGHFGASEPMNNRCLHKIKMGKSPVYGAGTSEIMLNSLMNNSEIESMVAQSLKQNKKNHAVSQLCSSYGGGTHKIDGYVFTNLLQGYIGDRKGCPNYTNKLKKLSKLTKSSVPKAVVEAPATEAAEPADSGSDVKNSNPAGTAN